MPTSAETNKFNDPFTSDFIVKCEDKEFHVHQKILQERSAYFEALLRSKCKEKREKLLTIDDFGPNVVEIFLQYLYNGAIPRISFVQSTESFSLMKIADKYNVNELFDALDSYLSQECMLLLSWCDKSRLMIEHYLRELGDLQAPKFTTMLYKWRSTEKGIGSLDDKQWSIYLPQIPTSRGL